MKYGLYGIYGVYNYGCEAIVRGAIRFIKDLDESNEVIYFSHNYEYDKNVLNDLDIQVVDVNKRVNFFQRVINFICRKLNIEFMYTGVNSKLIVLNCDRILSIGGDIYTIPQFVREKPKYSYLNNLVELCKRLIKRNIEVIVYGASIGPFGSYDKAINYFKNNLNKCKLLICREKRTIDYLKSIDVNNTVFLPDPAFLVKLKDSLTQEKKYIGVNLSPLSLKELYGKYDENSIKEMALLIEDIYQSFEKDILLIPHVFSEAINDDDYRFLKRISERINPLLKKHIIFSQEDKGFLGTKKLLRECEFVIAARMHCCVNALCENVPVIFLSYSDKSKGMCRYVYGDEKYLVNLKSDNLNEYLIKLSKELYENKETIIQSLEKRNQEILQDYNKTLQELKGKLNESNI